MTLFEQRLVAITVITMAAVIETTLSNKEVLTSPGSGAPYAL
jgi:hypothetical protein